MPSHFLPISKKSLIAFFYPYKQVMLFKSRNIYPFVWVKVRGLGKTGKLFVETTIFFEDDFSGFMRIVALQDFYPF
jgi:hypothetical protein